MTRPRARAAALAMSSRLPFSSRVKDLLYLPDICGWGLPVL